MLHFKRIRIAVAILGAILLPGLASAAASLSAVPTAVEVREREDERLALIKQIEDRYGITLADRTAVWTLDEVISVKAVLATIADRFAEIADRDVTPIVKAVFQDTALYRDQQYQHNIAYTVGGTVSVYDPWSHYVDSGRAFYVAHELGHVLDARLTPLQLFMGEVSTTFARNVGAYVNDAGVYQLGSNFPKPPTANRIRHRSDSAAEDWAESFATVIVPEFEADARDIGLMRRGAVRQTLARIIEYYSARSEPQWRDTER